MTLMMMMLRRMMRMKKMKKMMDCCCCSLTPPLRRRPPRLQLRRPWKSSSQVCCSSCGFCEKCCCYCWQRRVNGPRPDSLWRRDSFSGGSPRAEAEGEAEGSRKDPPPVQPGEYLWCWKPRHHPEQLRPRWRTRGSLGRHLHHSPLQAELLRRRMHLKCSREKDSISCAGSWTRSRAAGADWWCLLDVTSFTSLRLTSLFFSSVPPLPSLLFSFCFFCFLSFLLLIGKFSTSDGRIGRVGVDKKNEWNAWTGNGDVRAQRSRSG